MGKCCIGGISKNEAGEYTLQFCLEKTPKTCSPLCYRVGVFDLNRLIVVFIHWWANSEHD